MGILSDFTSYQLALGNCWNMTPSGQARTPSRSHLMDTMLLEDLWHCPFLPDEPGSGFPRGEWGSLARGLMPATYSSPGSSFLQSTTNQAPPPGSCAARTPSPSTKLRSPRNRSTRPRAKKLVLCGAWEVRSHRRSGGPGEGASSKPARGGVWGCFHFHPFLLSGQVWACTLGGQSDRWDGQLQKEVVFHLFKCQAVTYVAE